MAIFNIYKKGLIPSNIVGEDVSVGDIVYLSTDSLWYKASASTKETSTTELKIVTGVNDINNEVELLHYGEYSFEIGTLVSGDKYYLSTLYGKITNVKYDNSSNIIRYIGTAIDNDTLLFNPDQTYISDYNTKVNDVSIQVNYENFTHTHTESDISDLDKYTKEEVDYIVNLPITRVFNQGIPASTWNISHTLKKFPSVTIVDTSGDVIIGDIKFIDEQNIILTFSAPFAGKAYLN